MQEAGDTRLERGAAQRHSSFGWRASPLASVAISAARRDILPNVLAPARHWENVINRQISRSRSAVLAGEAVTLENVLAPETHAGARSPDVCHQSNHCWTRDGARWRLDRKNSVLEDLGLASIYQCEGTRHTRHGQDSVVLIQDQYTGHVCRAPFVKMRPSMERKVVPGDAGGLSVRRIDDVGVPPRRFELLSGDLKGSGSAT
jgi:hypothetical protein